MIKNEILKVLDANEFWLINDPIPTEKLEIDSLSIKEVIFNDPATIILWKDGTKTVVKCSENDEYDPEKGMAMAICKKILGNKGNYYSIFSKWLPEETEDNNSFKSVVDAFNNLAKMTRNAGVDLKTATSSIQGIANVEKHDIKISSEPKLITYREYIEKKYPEKCSMDSNGGIIACPGNYIRTGPIINEFDCKFHSDINACTKCFDQFIPLGSIDLRTGKPIYKEKNK